MESVSLTMIEYLPVESETVPKPEVESTLTASSGLYFEKSYTLPLTLTWALAEIPCVKSNSVNKNSIRNRDNTFF